MQELHQALKYLKTRNGWSNEKCADCCQVSLTTWKHLINGTLNNPRWDIIQCIAKGFDVPTDYLCNVRNNKMLTLEEYEHMQMYRSLPLDVQNGIKAIVIERYAYWVEQYRQHDHYNLRLKLREECSKLTIQQVIDLIDHIKKTP